MFYLPLKAPHLILRGSVKYLMALGLGFLNFCHFNEDKPPQIASDTFNKHKRKTNITKSWG